MSLPAWPSINYAPQRDSYRRQRPSPLSSDMNAGTTRRRNKYTLRIDRVSFSISMKDADLPTFETFVSSTLGGGAARFTMPVWNGVAYVTRNCAFQKDTAPEYAPHGYGYTLVTLALDVENL